MKRFVLTVVSTVVAAGLSISVAAAKGDWDAVAKALGRTGTEMPGGIYRVGLGRSDIKVTLDGVQIRPTRALGPVLAVQKMGSETAGVYGANIAGAETITEARMPIPIGMGSGIVINVQPTGGGKTAITGDFVLIAKEVNPVLRALRENGIEVTALHSHMLEEQPRLFFMHFWANDDAQKLAHALNTALSNVTLPQ